MLLADLESIFLPPYLQIRTKANMGHLACYGPLACTSWNSSKQVLSLGERSAPLMNAIRRGAVKWIIIGGGISTIDSYTSSGGDESENVIHLRARVPNPSPPILDFRVGIALPQTPASIYILGGN